MKATAPPSRSVASERVPPRTPPEEEPARWSSAWTSPEEARPTPGYGVYGVDPASGMLYPTAGGEREPVVLRNYGVDGPMPWAAGVNGWAPEQIAPADVPGFAYEYAGHRARVWQMPWLGGLWAAEVGGFFLHGPCDGNFPTQAAAQAACGRAVVHLATLKTWGPSPRRILPTERTGGE